MKSGATDYTRDSTRQSLLWSAPVCMGILANRIIQDANEALCSTMGYSHAELIGSSVRLLYENEQEFCRVGRTKYPIMAGKGWATIETRWRKKDGAVIDVLLTSAMFTPGDPRSGVLFVAHDISDRKSTERTLRVQNARWFDLFDNSPEGIVLLDTDLRILMANREFARMFGYDQQELIGRLSPDLVIPPDRAAEGEDAITRLKRGQTVRIEYTERCAKDGRRIPVSVLSKPIRIDGDNIGVYGIYRDITERVRADQEIRQSLREKEVLLQEVHHRVKNNLNVISSLLSLQQSEQHDVEVSGPLLLAKTRVHSMAMIHDLLYHSGNLTRVPFRQYLQDLIRYLSSAYGPLLSRVDVTLEVDDVGFDISTAIPVGLLVNEIIVNSMKHAFPEGRSGRITLELREGDNGFLLRIADDGIGPPATVEFESARSLGMELIRGLTAQLGADLSWDFSNGTACQLLIPAPGDQP